MKLVLLFLSVFSGALSESGTCLDCKEIIDGMVFKYEGCVEKVGQQTAVINTFQAVLTNGLQAEVDKVRRDLRNLLLIEF